MEIDIIEALNAMEYTGPIRDETKLLSIVKTGFEDQNYPEFVVDITNQIRDVCNIDETVNPLKTLDELDTFKMELSSFLTELGCAYECFTQGPISSRLSTEFDRLLLIDYLVSELMAARMINIQKPKNMEIKIYESPTAANLKKILQTLHFSKPPDNITVELLFSKLIPKLQTVIKDKQLGKPLFLGTLNQNQWQLLDKFIENVNTDFQLRKDILLKRLDTTIQSFHWSDRLKDMKDQIMAAYLPKRQLFLTENSLNVSDILAARTDLLRIQKISSARITPDIKSVQSLAKTFIMGKVPDRGGRPGEQAPPPPEKPLWIKKSNSGGFGGQGSSNTGGRGGRGGNRGSYNNYNRGGSGNSDSGNYNQGNYNQSNYDSSRTNYQQDAGAAQSSYSQGSETGSYSNYGNRGRYNNKGGAFGNRSPNYGNRGARSYNSFQHSKFNYANQFVQDNQRNTQYSERESNDYPRGNKRGRTNFNRGNFN